MNEERSSVKNRLIRYREINHFTIQPGTVFNIYSFIQKNSWPPSILKKLIIKSWPDHQGPPGHQTKVTILFSCLLCGLKKEEDREDKLNALRHDETNDVHFKLLAGIVICLTFNKNPFFGPHNFDFLQK